MRILHTSDWHLGRSFHREGMLTHQAAYVDHLLEVVDAERVDLVVVAGDVYDRALPHVDAVRLADETLARLAASRARVVLTSGNHDSAQRLGFSSRLIDAAGVFIRTDAGTRRRPGAARGRARPGRGPRHPLPRPRRGARAVGPRRAVPRGGADRGHAPDPRRPRTPAPGDPLGGAGPRLRGGRRRRGRSPATPSATSASAASPSCRRRSSTASTTPRWATCTGGTP